MPWTIYCHTHIESGRRYVGLTSQTWQKRWKNHISAAKSSKCGRWYFPNAIRKYGKDAFSHEVLETCDFLEAANVAEEKWILVFNSRNPEFGFNLSKGGAYTPPSDPKTIREKLSNATKNSMTSERRRYLSSLRKGKPLDQETRDKLSASAKKNSASIAERNKLRGRDYFVKMRKMMSPEIVVRTADKNRGRKAGIETRLKLSLAGTGRKLSQSAKDKISIKSRNPSLETRAKLSASGRKAVSLQERDQHGRLLSIRKEA